MLNTCSSNYNPGSAFDGSQIKLGNFVDQSTILSSTYWTESPIWVDANPASSAMES